MRSVLFYVVFGVSIFSRLGAAPRLEELRERIWYIAIELRTIGCERPDSVLELMRCTKTMAEEWKVLREKSDSTDEELEALEKRIDIINKELDILFKAEVESALRLMQKMS